LDALKTQTQQFDHTIEPRETGRIRSVSSGMARLDGLDGVGFEELVKFTSNDFGIAFDLDHDEVIAILLGDHTRLNAGDRVERLGRVMDVPVGDSLLGRVIDPLGRPLDGKGNLRTTRRLPIERDSAAIMDRAPVIEPLQTGIKAIDAMIPIGRGQRELIIGDRKTGKTTIAVDAILNQSGQDVICIYNAIGQRAAAVAKVIDMFRSGGAMPYTVVVVAEGNEPAGLSYIAPYAATSIAEHFMNEGKDVLIVYDDLTQHARAYRELSLLMRRPPGREAFPGDIFYIHARLLERSTHLKDSLGGGSLTALPIIETEEENIAAYIPTNLISITDGQIYLSPNLFELGVLPAIDVGKSVSRVGGKAQKAAYRAIVSDLKLSYAQYEELESFIRFGARLDEGSMRVIEHGRRIQACLKQSDMETVPLEEQILILIALQDHQFQDVPLEKMRGAQKVLQDLAKGLDPALKNRLSRDEELSDDDRKTLLQLTRETLESFMAKKERKARP
jgi:F-type H+/Na+-transporting ATPase subunit alpha